MQSRYINLENTTGSSFKTYRISLLESNGGFDLNVEYGRIGKPLRQETKLSGVTYGQAYQTFEKLLKEKRAKGYVVAVSADQDGQPLPAEAAASAPAERTDVPVMLLNPVSEARGAELVDDPAWGMELKYDGERRLIVIDGAEAYGVNRKGMKVPLAPAIRAAALAAPMRGLTILDGEDMGGEVVVFDVLAFDGEDMRHLSYRERIGYRNCARARLPGLSYASTAITAENKARMLADARTTVQEGVVFKRLASPHAAGRPNSGGDALKWKFTESASVRIASKHPSRRSVGMEVFDEASGQWVAVGNVTVPPNKDIPAVGDICEVQYLYAHENGSLYQPVYLTRRSDLDHGDCLRSQLKFVEERAELARAA